MAASDKWYFTKEQLENTPSRKCGYDGLKELSYRQQAANFIQDMGQRLKVTQLCINTAIVYMHRFYVFHSFTNFAWHQMAAAALFLAAKVEEQPRKLEYVIRISNLCRNSKDTSFDLTSEKYLSQSQDLVFNENVLLQTLGFDVAIDHPHTHVVRCCQLVRASKDLAQTSYFMASNSLHLTTMCLQYKPTVVACFCIHLACKWSNWEIPLSNEKKEWFSYVDPTVTSELLQQLTQEFLVIFESCPSRLKEKIMAIGDNIPHATGNPVNSPFENTEIRKIEPKDSHGNSSGSSRTQHDAKSDDSHKYRSSRPHDPNNVRNEREYREKKEKERLAAQQHALKQPTALPTSSGAQKAAAHAHHRHPVDPNKYKSSTHARPVAASSSTVLPPLQHPSSRAVEPREILRETPFGPPHRDSHHAKEQVTAVRDPQLVRGEKEKRDYLLKHNNSSNSGSSSANNSINELNNYKKYPPGYLPDKHRGGVEQNRPSRPVDHNKVPLVKQPLDQQQVHRTHEDAKNMNFFKETDNIKKHLNVASAVLKQSSSGLGSHKPEQVRPHYHNGNSSSSGPCETYPNPNLAIESDRIKVEPKEEIPTPAVVKRPSLFSPEKTPPQQHSTSLKTHSSAKKEDLQSPSTAPISFMPTGETSMGSGRIRNYSTGSEPELRPVMKKIDQVEGFENILRDSSIGIKQLQHTPDLISSEKAAQVQNMQLQNQTKQSSSAPLVNGIETNPILIRHLLKQTPQLGNVPQETAQEVANVDEKREKEHHHKSKKKNKEKHKHKDKDKDKKKKHKDKDKEKHRSKHEVVGGGASGESSEPKVVLKIQKDKIQSLQPGEQSTTNLKIKIPKDIIKTENVAAQPTTAPLGGLKIKIPKDLINNCNSGDTGNGGGSSRKRDRDRGSSDGGPPAKKSGSKDKQNGRHSTYNKDHLGDGDLTQNRLAESNKYSKTSFS